MKKSLTFGGKKKREREKTTRGRGRIPPRVAFVLASLFLLQQTIAVLSGNPVTHSGTEVRQWELLKKSIGISAMHMVLLHNDRVVVFDRTDAGPSNISLPNCTPATTGNTTSDCTAHSVEYDVASNTVRPLHVISDTWCSSGSVDADGTLIQTGGWGTGNRSLREFQTCDDGNCDWKEKSDLLAQGRWYASNQVLPDGRVIIVGGRRQFNYEFYPKGASNPGLFYFPFLRETYNYLSEDNLYPFLHLLPDGNLFVFANNRSIVFDYRKNAVVKSLPVMPGGGPRNYPSTGSSVMLPLVLNTDATPIKVEVLICGGAPEGSFFKAQNGTFVDALSSCGRITVTDPSPQWSIETMPMPRVMSDMLLLPTGDVLIINGGSSGTAGWEYARNPVLSPVVYRTWRPAALRFAVQNPSPTPRMYHSTAVLLRDGRVLVGGSNTHRRYSFSDALFPTDLSLERFSPDYCFSASRPTLLSPDSQMNSEYGKRLTVRFSVAGVNASESAVFVSLVAPSFNTHSFSMNQRILVLQKSGGVVPLAIAPTGSINPSYELIVSLPESANMAPAGYYLLFVVVGEVASEGIWIHIQ